MIRFMQILKKREMSRVVARRDRALKFGLPIRRASASPHSKQ
jgi:hypothetical protein